MLRTDINFYKILSCRLACPSSTIFNPANRLKIAKLYLYSTIGILDKIFSSVRSICTNHGEYF